ncbi:MAG TPA: hypothetical protein VEA81_13320 [Burkholderiaceae bacterium]|nr:hypothetical protein [Burkholderiaceae bacterium]
MRDGDGVTERGARRAVRAAGRAAAIAVAAAAGLGAPAAHAQSDSWFGRDKAAHAGVSAPIGAYAAGLAGPDASTAQRVALGTVIGGLPGLAKEFVDMRTPGRDPSARDMVANLAGAALGALLVDCCIVRPLTRHGRVDGIGIEYRLDF